MGWLLGREAGAIEVVPNARTISSIQRSYGGSLAALSEEPLLSWFREQNSGDPEALQQARHAFAKSCAGEAKARGSIILLVVPL